MAQQIKGKQIAKQTITINSDEGNVIVSGVLDTNGHQVIQTSLPTASTHLANKAYVDAMAQGVSPHAPVRVVSTTNLTLSGVTTVDEILLAEGNSILVAGQTDKKENGLWTVHTPGGWSRREDANGDPENEVQLGDFTFVLSGTTNANSGWVLGKTDSPDMPIIPGVETQEWFIMAAPGSYQTDEEGLHLAGNVFSLDLDGTTLTKGEGGLKLSDTLSTVISNNTVNISTEITNRTTDDQSLSTAVSTEISDRTVADASLTTSLSTEISQRTSADISLTTAVGGGVSSLSTVVSTADASLSTSISGEVSSRTSGDLSLSTQISQMSGATLDLSTIMVEGQVLGILGGNLTGVSYTSIVTSLSTVVSTADASLTTSLSTEILQRTSADTSLTTGVSSLSTAVRTADTSLTTSLSTEISQRTSADTSLTTGVSSLSTVVSTADASLTTSLSTEISQRTSADASLTTAIGGGVSSLSTVVSSADASLTTSLSIEISQRTSADESLTTAVGGGVSSLSTVVSLADASLTTSLSTEILQRTSADTSLTTGVSSLSTAVRTADTSLTTSLSTEILQRTSADTSLTTGVSSLSTVVSTADTSLSTAIAALSSGSTAGVTSLSLALSTEILQRTSADTSLTTSVSSLSTVVSTADASLTTSLSTEVSNRTVADASLSAAISDIRNPEMISESFLFANAGSTGQIIVDTAVFDYGAGVVDLDSVIVFMNGLQYPFTVANAVGSIFNTQNTTPSGTAITLYFNADQAGFSAETTDQVVIKYMVTT